MTERAPVATPDAPAAIGPYSQAIRAGDFVFCSGQIALDPATNELIGGDVEAQTKRVMENLRAVLEAAGSGLDRAVKTTIFLKDMDDFARVNQVYGSFFAEGSPPARATVQVSRLPKDVDIEIDCIALAEA